MYFIKRIKIDDKQHYQSSEIINHTMNTLTDALLLLEKCIRDFIKDERGREASEQTKIIDIQNINQINEPLLDCIQLYRLENNPNQIFVYQKYTTLVKSTSWVGTTRDSTVSKFRETDIFELEYVKHLSNPIQNIIIQHDININSSNNNRKPNNANVEMVAIGSSNVKIPKPMTLSPIRDMINELKQSPKFKSQFILINS
jgi:hypothetical protein